MSETNTPITLLEELYFSWSKKKAIAIEPFPESGSYRRYFRITGEGKRYWAFTTRISARTMLLYILTGI